MRKSDTLQLVIIILAIVMGFAKNYYQLLCRQDDC